MKKKDPTPFQITLDRVMKDSMISVDWIAHCLGKRRLFATMAIENASAVVDRIEIVKVLSRFKYISAKDEKFLIIAACTEAGLLPFYDQLSEAARRATATFAFNCLRAEGGLK